jgi:hypothetical protein
VEFEIAEPVTATKKLKRWGAANNDGSYLAELIGYVKIC